MLKNWQLSHRVNEFMETKLGIEGMMGRLYLTTPTFSIDVNVESVQAEAAATNNLSRWGEFGGLMCVGNTHEITLKCQVRGMDVLTIMDKVGSDLYQLPLSHRSKVFCLSPERRPPPPMRPIWLPGGVWNCNFCSSAQLADLLQCRGCGAPRFGKDLNDGDT